MFFQPMPYQAQGKLEPVMTALIIKGVHTDSNVTPGTCVMFDTIFAQATTFDPTQSGALQGSTTPPNSCWSRVSLPSAGTAPINCLGTSVFAISRSTATGSTSVFTPIDLDVIRIFASGTVTKTASATASKGGCYMPVGAAGTLSVAAGTSGRKIVLIADFAYTTTTLGGMFNGFGFGQDIFA